MSNEVRFSITGDTNAEQVAGRVKASVGSIEGQIGGIQRKFGNAFKDIILSVAGPLAILHLVLSMISNAIQKNREDVKAAMDLAAEGKSEFTDETTAYLAAKDKKADADKEEQRLAKIGKEETTRRYIEENNLKVMNELGPMGYLKYATASYGYASKQEDVQKAVERLVAREMRNQGPTYGVKPTDFKTPEGFSNIVGVGANPVLEAMTAQLEEQRRQTMLLDKIANGTPTNTDFTKKFFDVSVADATSGTGLFTANRGIAGSIR